MAKSPSHSLGQIIGYAMEQSFYDMLLKVGDEYGLYVDRQGPRAARTPKKKVTWTDDVGNKHDLDFVLENGGAADVIGTPAAFIESAWRRYTKHSVNKAGEIANALVPLRRTYAFHRPFLGALVAGEWTAGGIQHMESQGISVLHLPIEVIVESFLEVGINVYFEENTPQDRMAVEVSNWSYLSAKEQGVAFEALRTNASERFDTFGDLMRSHFSRRVESVRILPLHGLPRMASSVAEAIAMLTAMDEPSGILRVEPLHRIEIQVRYSDSDRVEAAFGKISEAMLWLESNYLGE